jgi:hypothetical protein
MARGIRYLHHAYVQIIDVPQNSIPSEELIASKSQKQLVLAGAAKFNTKPKLGIEFLEENKLIYADGLPRPLSLAKFLRSCSRLDKKLLGDFVSRPDNLAVLEEFMGLLDFKGVGVKPFYVLSRVLIVIGTSCRSNARAPRSVQITRRGSADRPNHGDLCIQILCNGAWWVFIGFMVSTS